MSEKPLTDRSPDPVAETQAFAYAYGKRAAQDIGDAFLCGVEYQKRRQDAAAPAMLAALKELVDAVDWHAVPVTKMKAYRAACAAIASAEGRYPIGTAAELKVHRP